MLCDQRQNILCCVKFEVHSRVKEFELKSAGLCAFTVLGAGKSSVDEGARSQRDILDFTYLRLFE